MICLWRVTKYASWSHLFPPVPLRPSPQSATWGRGALPGTEDSGLHETLVRGIWDGSAYWQGLFCGGACWGTLSRLWRKHSLNSVQVFFFSPNGLYGLSFYISVAGKIKIVKFWSFPSLTLFSFFDKNTEVISLGAHKDKKDGRYNRCRKQPRNISKGLKMAVLLLETRDAQASKSQRKVLSLLLQPKPNVIKATWHSRKPNLF